VSGGAVWDPVPMKSGGFCLGIHWLNLPRYHRDTSTFDDGMANPSWTGSIHNKKAFDKAIHFIDACPCNTADPNILRSVVTILPQGSLCQKSSPNLSISPVERGGGGAMQRPVRYTQCYTHIFHENTTHQWLSICREHYIVHFSWNFQAEAVALRRLCLAYHVKGADSFSVLFTARELLSVECCRLTWSFRGGFLAIVEMVSTYGHEKKRAV